MAPAGAEARPEVVSRFWSGLSRAPNVSTKSPNPRVPDASFRSGCDTFGTRKPPPPNFPSPLRLATLNPKPLTRLRPVWTVPSPSPEVEDTRFPSSTLIEPLIRRVFLRGYWGGLVPQVVTYNTVLKACEAGGRARSFRV